MWRPRTPLQAAFVDNQRKRSQYNFGKRTYGMRVLGLSLGALCVGAVLYEQQRASWVWGLLLFNCLLWPHLAYGLVRLSRHPIRAEYRNLTLDAAWGGFWIASMAFDTLPSVLLAAMLTMDKILSGGWRFSLKTFAVMAATCVLASAAWGFEFEPHTSFRTMLACLPLLVVYPLAIGLSSRRLAEKILRQKRLIENNSRFDIATGLMNRQQWEYAATLELTRFLRINRPSVLMMIDIDYFKQINDGYGHTVGDSVIEEFARLLKACLRDIDTGGRYGGDEFGVVMPETLWEEAIVAAERLRRQVAAYVFPQGGLRCTISVGLAQINPSITTVNEWITAADEALYVAKRRGRDCIEVAHMPVAVPGNAVLEQAFQEQADRKPVIRS